MKKLTNLNGCLLEGCVWDEQRGQIFFVDIECRKIYSICLKNNKTEEMSMHERVGCIVLRQEGTLIAALADGLYSVDFDKKRYEKIMESGLEKRIRYNDGKCDSRGRLWVGSMAAVQDEHAQGAGALYCIEKEQIRQCYPDFTIPNGLAWDENAGYFYHIDTPTKKVDRYCLTDGGEIRDRETVIDLNGQMGSPDGMCIDEQGNLWIAMWGGGKVICADPRTGNILEELPVGDWNVSCCTFGGDRLDRLFITTARDETGNGGELYMAQMKTKGVTANRYGWKEKSGACYGRR